VQALFIVKNFISTENPKVLGLSDAQTLEEFMLDQSWMTYLNTFIDTEPTLDVSNPDAKFANSCDVLISSDVFEHVMHPLSNSILGAKKILKPGGWLILTMPWTKFGNSVEHYPWMRSYDLDEMGDVFGISISGERIKIDNPIFHGGSGQTLEIRFMSLYSLIDLLHLCGFEQISVLDQDDLENGISRNGGNIGTIICQAPSTQIRLFSPSLESFICGFPSLC
jgi:SAM-dependent methyltransferase